MRVLILGGAGMLGHKLVQQFSTEFEIAATFREFPAGAPYSALFDGVETYSGVVADEISGVASAISHFRPDVVVNAIGVIKQLSGSKDVITSLATNSIFPQRVAELAQAAGFRFIHVSTDCVFDGRKGDYTEADIPDALDLYGQSKHWGEVTGEGCLTLRTSIIGRELGTSHSLVDWFLSNKNGAVKGFRRAIYSGFPTILFADIIRDLILEHPALSGLYQVSSDPINKFDLLELINKDFGSNITIEPYDDFEIDRSLDSTRFKTATGFVPKSWPEMIKRMAEDKTPYDLWK